MSTATSAALTPERTVEAGPAAVAARKYAVELIGTFFLIFTVGTVSLAGAALAPLAIGAVLVAMVYAGGHISGGHYNPAVTVAALVRGRIGVIDAVGYCAAQLFGGVLAALVVLAVAAPGEVEAMSLSVGPAFGAELLVTFALAYVVLNVATSRDHPENSFYGLAIGVTVLAGAVAVGGISGGAFNPAVALGVSVIGLFAWSNLWLYLVANLLAGALAGLAFRLLNPADR